MESKHKKPLIDTIVVLLILLMIDSPLFVSYVWFKGLVLAVIVIIAFYYKVKISDDFLALLLIVTLLITLQAIRWNMYFYSFVGYYFIVLLLPYLAVKKIGIKYLDITSNIVFYVSIISLFLFSSQVLIPGFTSILFKIESYFRPFSSVPIRPSILIYSIATNVVGKGEMSDFLRNPGFFHEPGAFAVFISLAIAINLLKGSKAFDKKNIILLTALATTFSTAGFISTISMYLFYFYKNVERKSLFIGLLIAIIPVLIYIFQLPFMTKKIEKEFKEQTSGSVHMPTSGRFLGARKALIVLSRYPITGRGLTKGSRVTDYRSEEKAGYGFMLFFSTLGIPISVLFIYFFIKAMKRIAFYYSGDVSLWPILGLGLFANLFSQKFISDQFFTMMLIIGISKNFSLDSLKVKQIYRNETPNNRRHRIIR